MSIFVAQQPNWVGHKEKNPVEESEEDQSLDLQKKKIKNNNNKTAIAQAHAQRFPACECVCVCSSGVSVLHKIISVWWILAEREVGK